MAGTSFRLLCWELCVELFLQKDVSEPKRYPGTCECDLIWKWGLCRSNPVKMKSYQNTVGPKSQRIDWCPHKQRRDAERCRDMRTKVMCCHKPRSSKNCQQPPVPGESPGTYSPSEPQEGTSPADIFIQTLSSWTVRGYSSGPLSHLVCSTLLWQPLGNWQCTKEKKYRIRTVPTLFSWNLRKD